MDRGRNALHAACWIALGTLAAGCQTPQTSGPSVRRPSVKIDVPCAERLHDVCGQLLLYHSVHKRLPRTLDELKTTGISPMPPLVCPVSGKPYLYNPDGLQIPDQPHRLVLYDATASHSGMRWGIFVSAPKSRTPLTSRVILVPDQSVTSARKTPASTGTP